MDNVSQNQQNFNSRLDELFKKVHLSKLLKSAGFKKRENYGASVFQLFVMIFNSCFFLDNKTIYGNYTSHKKFNICCPKTTIYNFIGSIHNNWRKLHLLLAKVVITYIMTLNDSDRKTCFIIDDTMLERAKAKHVELLANVFDHVRKAFIRGFTDLQIGWTDGVSYIPMLNALLSSSNMKNIYVKARSNIDKRTCGYKRRAESMLKKPIVAINMIQEALNMGIKADYVLMDSWFTTEPFIKKINDLGLHVIGMVKALTQVYNYNGNLCTLHELFQKIPNKSKRSIICSDVVKTKNGIDVKMVFVRNRNIKREYLAILSTDINLSDEDIVKYYSRRWFIETSFKAHKQYFKLGSESYGRSYDNSFAFVTISSIRYIILELDRRLEEDYRSYGEIFRNGVEQMPDIPFIVAINTLIEKVKELPEILDKAGVLKENCKEKTATIIKNELSLWFTGLNDYMQNLFNYLKEA